jgi:hypothetical protein
LAITVPTAFPEVKAECSGVKMETCTELSAKSHLEAISVTGGRPIQIRRERVFLSSDYNLQGSNKQFFVILGSTPMATPDEQLQAMRLLGENWDGYCAAAPQGHLVDLAREFAGLIDALSRKRAVDPCVVHLSPSRTGCILIEWEGAAVQYEVEINPDQSFAFLHLNKATGSIETRKLSPGAQAVVHPGLFHELSQLLAS